MTILTIPADAAKELDNAKHLQGLAAAVRHILSDIPPRSVLLIPNLRSPAAAVGLVLRCRAKSIVPVWFNGKEYLRFPRGT